MQAEFLRQLMSDIPLHKIRRNRHLTEHSGIALSPDTMPAAVVAKAVVSSRRNRDYKSGKRNDRYTDDSDEEQGLLGSPSLEDGDDYHHRAPVRFVLSSCIYC
jgi:phospholipid-translocating ATPase